jgi:hypothetical protein
MRANHIMGDLCEVNNILLAPNGEDFAMAKESERESNNLNRLTYTQDDKKILRQSEGAAGSAKHLSLLLQDRSTLGAIYSSQFDLSLKQTTSESFTIVADISHMGYFSYGWYCGSSQTWG